MRYAAPEQPTALRLLCSSRNLTFDRSWDTLLVLDAEVGEGPAPVSEPLASFIEALPGLAVSAPPDRVREDVALLAGETRRAAFRAPNDLELLAFHPMGLRAESPDPISGRIDRLLVVSPFVGGERLRALAGRRASSILVSRPEELATVPPERLSAYTRVLVLSDAATPEAVDESARPGVEPSPEGLHAKLYVADCGWDARLWTGSANATDQAFRSNVELLVELGGRKRVCGVDAVLASGDRATPGLRDLLDDYRMHAAAPAPDEEGERRRHLVDRARAAITRARIWARVVPDADGEYDVLLESEGATLAVPSEVTARCRPITVGDGLLQALSPVGPVHARFRALGVRQVSAFFAVSLTLAGGAEEVERFTLAVPLRGAPGERTAAVLSELLRDRRDLIRFLLLLLAADETAASERLNDLRRLLGGPGDGDAESAAGLPLLEPMLRALARDPSRIDQVARVIEELRATPDGGERLPERLDDVWDAIRAVREAAR